MTDGELLSANDISMTAEIQYKIAYKVRAFRSHQKGNDKSDIELSTIPLQKRHALSFALTSQFGLNPAYCLFRLWPSRLRYICQPFPDEFRDLRWSSMLQNI